MTATLEKALRRARAPLAIVASLLACRPETGPAMASCPAPPANLAATGLYEETTSLTVARDNLPYVPQYPLWTDGATKRRWIHVPEGRTIDASDPEHWVFPVGTKLWKEFSFGQRVETRYIERATDERWIYATYVWTADGREARLAPDTGIRSLCQIGDGLHHDIPSQADCRACHEGSRNRVLGFGALQLSTDRDALALHREEHADGAVDLARLVEQGLVRGLPPGVLEAGPRIAARTPRERAVLGYFHANCASCHNADAPHSATPLQLQASLAARPGEGPAIRSTVNEDSHYRPGGRQGLRIAAGAPDRSLLVERMTSRHPITQMPPLGTHRVDAVALALIEQWIEVDLVPMSTTSPPHATIPRDR